MEEYYPINKAFFEQTAKEWREADTSKEKRFEMLVKTAISQYQRLSQHPGMKRLEGK